MDLVGTRFRLLWMISRRHVSVMCRFVPKVDILRCGRDRRYSITSSAVVTSDCVRPSVLGPGTSSPAAGRFPLARHPVRTSRVPSAKMIKYAEDCTDAVLKDELLRMSANWLKLTSTPSRATKQSISESTSD